MPRKLQTKPETQEARRANKRRASSFVVNTQHPITATFGAALRVKRLHCGLTQAQLAEMTGLNRSYISEVENGKQSISLERADRLAKAVRSQLIDLLGGTMEDKAP